MLTYELESYENGKKIYNFYPDILPNAVGKVAFYDNGNIEIIQDSAVDVKRYYASHAVSGIDTSKKSDIVAWC